MTAGVPPLSVLSLFSGIGGLDLGLERAGMTVVGQVEIDPFCRQVLSRHWPDVPCHDDVRTFPGWWDSAERPTVDVVAGGFPCQPVSMAGKRRGSEDERWGWGWMRDAVRHVRPRYVVLENVQGLLSTAEFPDILADLSELGFDAEWSVVSACSVGAPHVRKRLFVVAYPNGEYGKAWLGGGKRGCQETEVLQDDNRESAWNDQENGPLEADGYGRRVVDGLSARMEPSRVKTLGNSVVPQVAEIIGRFVIELAKEES